MPQMTNSKTMAEITSRISSQFTESPEGVAAVSCAVVANVIVSNAERTAAFLFNPVMQDNNISDNLKIQWLVGFLKVKWQMAQFTDLFFRHLFHVDEHENKEYHKYHQPDHGEDIDVLDLICMVPDKLQHILFLSCL
jgi:hypothetical protein